MEGNLCSGMGRGCRGSFCFLLGEGRGGRRRELCVESGTFFFQYAGCNTACTYLMSRGVSC